LLIAAQLLSFESWETQSRPVLQVFGTSRDRGAGKEVRGCRDRGAFWQTWHPGVSLAGRRSITEQSLCAAFLLLNGVLAAWPGSHQPVLRCSKCS
jgi:hypothetical protein